MYAPLIQENITITVTGEVAKDVIAWAELGRERDDCWSLRDGTTTTDPRKALTDAIVVVAEDTHSQPWPHRQADDPAPADQSSTTGTGASTGPSEAFVNPLERDEALALLQTIDESRDPDTRKRAAIIVASYAGITTSQIAAMYAIDTVEVQTVIAEFNEHGVASIGGD